MGLTHFQEMGSGETPVANLIPHYGSPPLFLCKLKVIIIVNNKVCPIDYPQHLFHLIIPGWEGAKPYCVTLYLC